MGVLASPSHPPPKTFQRVPATLCSDQLSLLLEALIDSGAEDNFLDYELVIQSGLPLEPLTEPFTANALDGCFLAKITHRTAPCNLILSGVGTQGDN